MEKHKKAVASTQEGREDRLIALALERAEEQLREGTASSQVITHFLKLGTAKAKKELEIMESQKKLMEAKVEAIESAARIEQLYKDAMLAMKTYSGKTSEAEDDEDIYSNDQASYF